MDEVLDIIDRQLADFYEGLAPVHYQWSTIMSKDLFLHPLKNTTYEQVALLVIVGILKASSQHHQMETLLDLLLIEHNDAVEKCIAIFKF